ncbi:superoxide dismutase [Candidatus Parcubacteria bacterium]|jgi:superoxide dismutase, Fe-Mn family|nr:superoxide dismutase [Candidatus Parcubacteria bacterium]
MEHTLYKLPYSFDALEPYIDAATMEIHYTKHHQAYLDNFKKVVEKYPELQDKSAENILQNLKSLNVDEADRKALQNHGGGFVNHNIYWSIMGPEKEIDETLVNDIEKTFDSLDSFKELFNLTATKQFGSGWAWLVRDENQELKVYSLPNQDSPLTLRHTPILALDVWEHAYYLKYQNKRAEYIENWWNVVKII